MNKLSQSEPVIFDVVLASKGSNFSEVIYIFIDVEWPSFPNSFIGYKLVHQFLLLSRLSVEFGLRRDYTGPFAFC